MTKDPSINYQQIYEQEISDGLKMSLEWPDRYFELSSQARLMIEELVDFGYSRAVEDALDPEILFETAELAGDMGTQLYNFANMVKAYVSTQQKAGDEG